MSRGIRIAALLVCAAIVSARTASAQAPSAAAAPAKTPAPSPLTAPTPPAGQSSASAQAPDRSKPPQPGPLRSLQLPETVHLRLKNGIPVFLIERHKVPLVQITVVLRSGAAADPALRPGLASLTAQLLERGAGTRTALEISDLEDFLGANLSAGADWDASNVGINVPVAQLAPGVGLLSDLVIRPTFPAEELERVRQELLTEMLQRKDEPAEIAESAFALALYAGHPYGRRIDGNESSVRAITREDVRRFHAARYGPGSSAIIVAGDVTAAALLPVLESAFGGWSQPEAAAVPAPPPAPQISGRRVLLVDKPGAAQSQIWIGRVGPPRSTPDYFDLLIANTIFGGSFTSRLNHNLRETKGYTYGAFSGFSYRLSTGPFYAIAAVQTDKTGPALVEFFKELTAIRSGIPEEEIRRAKSYAALRFPGGFETATQVAGKVRDQFVFGLPDDYFNTYVARIQAATTQGVQRAAATWIDPANCVVVVVGDRKKIEAEVAALKLGPIRYASADEVLAAGTKGGKRK